MNDASECRCFRRRRALMTLGIDQDFKENLSNKVDDKKRFCELRGTLREFTDRKTVSWQHSLI